MKIKLQKNNSENIRMDKTIVDVLELNGTLKGECSLINPIILIECSENDIINSNYVNIPKFKRSYFIVNVTSVRNNIYEISLHCDVLSSFKNEIRNCDGIIGKNENKYNLYIDDGTFKVYSNPVITTKLFPQGFTTQSFVLTVAGG